MVFNCCEPWGYGNRVILGFRGVEKHMSNNASYGSMQANHPAIVEKYNGEIDKILGKGQWELSNTDVQAAYSEKLTTGKYKLVCTFGKKTPVASFELHPMINCCGMCISTQARVEQQYQGKGLGTILNSLRVDIARHLGYGCLLCTDIESNVYQRKILARNGWKDVHKFVNPRTKNTIFVSVINL